MDAVRSEERVLPVTRDSALTTIAAWDFGWADLTVVWFAQLNGTEVRLIDCKAYHHTKLGDVLDDLPHADNHLLPHDAVAHELISGMARVDVFNMRGIDYEVVQRPKSINDVIDAGRRLLPRCWFDTKACKTGIEALTLYRAAYDDVKRNVSKTPVHDWTSHYADAFGVLAQGLPVSTKPFNWGGKLKYDNAGVI
jgi:phage terminase large subunit